MNNNPAQRGLILFAHGSRDPQWCAPMQAVAARVAALEPSVLVRCAYLELMPPDLPSCAAALALEGVSSITVLPLFLGMGRHAREDLPVLMAQLRAQHPELHFDLRPTVGSDARVIDLLAHMALQDCPPV